MKRRSDETPDVEFYRRPLVRRLIEIFDRPKPPASVTEEQFDGFQKELVQLAGLPWDEIGRDHYWYYLLDLAYVDLQQDLFDYLFPAFLIRWWEGQVSRMGGPEAESDIYYAIDQGQVLTKMMSPKRRQEVLDWMVDAYMDGVDAWSGEMSVHYRQDGPGNLHGPLWTFHALGQSVPVCRQIWERLSQVETPGRAQWWLVIGTGFAYNENEAPWIPAWSPSGGGGGVYMNESAASIFNHGYLDQNLEAMLDLAVPETILLNLEKSREHLHGIEREWAEDVLRVLVSDQDRYRRRHERWLELLSRPNLGGVLRNPLEEPEIP